MDFVPATIVLSGRISPRFVILGLFSYAGRFDADFLVRFLASSIDRSLNFAPSVDKLLNLADTLKLSLDKSKQKIRKNILIRD